MNNMGYVSSKFIAVDGCRIKANASKKFTGTVGSFEKKRNTYMKMIRRLIKRCKRLENRIENGEVSAAEAETEKKRICRLERDYTNNLRKIDSFLKEENEEDVKSQVNLTDSDSVLQEKNNKYFQGFNDSDSIGSLVRDSYKVLIPSKIYPDADSAVSISSRQCSLRKNGLVCILTCPGGQVMEKDYTGKSHGLDYYIFYADRQKCISCKYYSKCAGKVKRKKVFKVKKEVFSNLKEINRLKKMMKDPSVMDLYYKRFGSIEPAFGTITSNRGFSGFLVQGLKKVNLHWKMVCTAFNLRRMFVLQQA
jgi:coenzyme F420-reducing hydrogenase delta subunit